MRRLNCNWIWNKYKIIILSCNHPEQKLTSAFLILASWFWLRETSKEIRSIYVILWQPVLNNISLKGTLMLHIILQYHFSLWPFSAFAFSSISLSDNRFCFRCYLSSSPMPSYPRQPLSITVSSINILSFFCFFKSEIFVATLLASLATPTFPVKLDFCLFSIGSGSNQNTVELN